MLTFNVFSSNALFHFTLPLFPPSNNNNINKKNIYIYVVSWMYWLKLNCLLPNINTTSARKFLN